LKLEEVGKEKVEVKREEEGLPPAGAVGQGV
jgi:hypothetical protein